jgi:hypothetical protein
LFGVRILLTGALVLSVIQGKAAPAAQSEQPPWVITVEASQGELLEGYLRWLHRHPEAIHHSQPARALSSPGSSADSAGATQSTEPLLIRMPSIELYSRSGVSLYHGTDSEKNAVFIRALNEGPKEHLPEGNEMRPTLDEAVEMLAELDLYRTALKGQEYTMMALTYPNKSSCRAQNDAVQQLESSSRQLGIRVIEVQIHK